MAAALGADPQMTLTLCAVKRASEIAMGSKEETLQLVGFPPAAIQDPESVRNQLAEIFSTYLTEIWEIVQVSSVSGRKSGLAVRWFFSSKSWAIEVLCYEIVCWSQ